jgi:hypothetical protein
MSVESIMQLICNMRFGISNICISNIFAYLNENLNHVKQTLTSWQHGGNIKNFNEFCKIIHLHCQIGSKGAKELNNWIQIQCKSTQESLQIASRH